ncbi:MAG: MogA/MoaB family molybdenum cofactor biosynthesis protein [Thermosynechococcaceae cyanobacterium]
MGSHPHPDSPDHGDQSVSCGILTISDTRTQHTDFSGRFLRDALVEQGHQVTRYSVLPDQPDEIERYLRQSAEDGQTEALICTGGTGIAARDVTYDVVARLFEKELTGFGELFRMLSYQEIGSRAIASRATAGVYQQLLIFILPGSLNAVTLATEQLILPELRHLTQLLRQ